MKNLFLLLVFTAIHFFSFSQSEGVTDLNVNGEISCTNSCAHYICPSGDAYSFYYPRSTYCPAASSISYFISYNTSLGIPASLDDKVNGVQVEVKWNPAYFETGATATLSIYPTFPSSQVPNTTCPTGSFSVTISSPLPPTGSGGSITGPAEIVRRSEAYSYYLDGTFQNASEYHWYLDNILIGSQRTLSYSFSQITAGSHTLKCIPSTKCGEEGSLEYNYPINVSIACEGSIVITGESELKVGETRRVYLNVANPSDYTWSTFPAGLENLGPHFQGGINVKFLGTGDWELKATSNTSVSCGEITKTFTVVQPCISGTTFSSEVVTLPAPPNQNLIISSGCDVTYISTESVILKKGIVVQEGGSLTIRIDQTPPSNPDYDLDKHWTITTVYDENGNAIGSVKEFTDKLGRSTQTQSKSYSTGHVFATQILYDEDGEAVLSTLPAPIWNQEFNYKEGFLINSANQQYSHTDFDTDINNPTPVGVGDIGTVGWYYSNKNNLEPYTDVTSFPYSRSWTEKSPDPSVSKGAGPGDRLRMGTGKESVASKVRITDDPVLKHYYDLRRLHFVKVSVENAGEGYKITSEDPNGKEAYTYLNANGEALISAVKVENEFHYSYSFFDDAGNLVNTVAPNGVVIGNLDYPSFVTTYSYNQLGWLLSVESPDEGLTKFVYSNDGKLRFSQNALQRSPGAGKSSRFAYTNYDESDRVTETGEYEMSGADAYIFQDHLNTPSGKSILDIVNERGEAGALDAARCKERHLIVYDIPSNNFASNDRHLQQNFLFGRPSKTENDNVKTWYSYDQFGRLEWTQQVIKDLGEVDVKTISYTYDFNGNVLEVAYQKGISSDQFYHYYEYNQDQQLSAVYTSRDGEIKTLQAKYYYYLHGPLKRVELAGNLQGTDLVYNIQGMLKAINHPDNLRDPGKDGSNGFAQDVFGMTFEYFNGDYTRTGTNIGSINPGTDYPEQFGGSIRAYSWKTKKPSSVSGPNPSMDNSTMYAFKYDDQYQFKESSWGTPDFVNNGFTAVDKYKEHDLQYDKNGNITKLQRTKDGVLANESFTSWTYEAGKNRLQSVAGYASYTYDALGQMLTETKGATTKAITYNAAGSVTKVTESAVPVVEYKYDDAGQRVKKVTGNGTLSLTTYYVRDAAGNVMAVYDNNGGTLAAREFPVYAAGRIGQFLTSDNSIIYEMTDHLGNVRSLISKKTDGTIDIKDYTDYYAFGGEIEGRSTGTLGYKYGYQGQFSEKDKANSWESFELRNYDPKIGRWLSTDPYGQFWSPYLAMGNDPVNGVDPDGGWGWSAQVWYVAGGAVAGGAIGGLIANYNGEDAWKGALIGAAAGAAAGYGLSQISWGSFSASKIGAHSMRGVAGVTGGVPIRIKKAKEGTWIRAAQDWFEEWVGYETLFQAAFEDPFGPGNLGKMGGKVATRVGSKIIQRVLRHTKFVTHHIASNKHLTKYTPQFKAIANKYNLSLNGAWNKVQISDLYHYSNHPDTYHEFVLRGMRAADAAAKGSVETFLKVYDELVKQPLLKNPNMLNKSGL